METKPTLCPHCREIIWGSNIQYKEVYKVIENNWPTNFANILRSIYKELGFMGEGRLSKVLKVLLELGLIRKSDSGNYKPGYVNDTGRV